MYYAKRSNSVKERQILYDLTHMWNLRNKTDDHRGREEKNKTRQNQRGRQTTQVLYKTNESLTSTSEIINTLYVN